MNEPETDQVLLSVWQRCWCYRFGRCLVDCPTADLPRPSPLTDDAWQQAYADVLDGIR